MNLIHFKLLKLKFKIKLQLVIKYFVARKKLLNRFENNLVEYKNCVISLQFSFIDRLVICSNLFCL